MRIVTGDDCGLLKEVIPELCRRPKTDDAPSTTSIQAAASSVAGFAVAQQQRAVRRLEPGADAQGRARGVVALAFLPADGPRDETDDDDEGGDGGAGGSAFRFAALRAHGGVELWSGARPSGYGKTEVHVTPAAYRKYGGLATGSVLQKDEEAVAPGANGTDGDGAGGTGWHTHQPVRPIGLVSTHHHDAHRAGAPVLATCDSIGNVALLRAHDMAAGVVARYNAFDVRADALPAPCSSGNDRGGRGTLTYTKGGFANAHIATAVALCGDRLAVGGRERGVRVLDLERGTLLWKAKNLPPDPQTLLQQPMWTTAMQYLHTPTAYTNGSNGAPHNLLATGSAYKQVQIYDIRAASTTRRPVLYTPEKLLSHRTTALCQLPDGHTLAVGDAAGDCHLLDLRHMHHGHVNANRRHKKSAEEIGLGRLVGPGGAIRQLAVHPTLPYLACVGLDRKLWTWDVTRRKMVDCVYLKQKLNCVLFCEDASWDGMDGDSEEEETVRDGEEMEAVGVKTDKGLAEEDDVEDYVDSEDDTDAGKSKRHTASNGGAIVRKCSEHEKDSSSTSSEDIASDSSEEEGDSQDEDGEASDEEDSSSSEEEDPATTASSVNPNKRRRKQKDTLR